jgi:type IV pilus assembly protein PilY1
MIYFGTGRSYTTDDNSGTTVQGTQQQDIYGVSDNSQLTGLATACQVMPATSSQFNAATSVVTATGGASSTGVSGVSTLAGLQTALMATNPTTGCYIYSGWELPLAQGNATNAAVVTTTGSIPAQQPSERVISSQTLFDGFLLTPTYIPPNAQQIVDGGSSTCDPIPVPGMSKLYGLDYLTGTADPLLSGSFGLVGTAVSNSVSLGSGIASAPVLHVSSNGTVSAAFGIAGVTKLQSLGTPPGVNNGEISWREPVDKQ